MQVIVRLSSPLAQLVGRPRVPVQLADYATVGDLLVAIRDQYPSLNPELDRAIPVIGGRHALTDESVSAQQELALLLPIAGGQSVWIRHVPGTRF
jgi:molybdopterin synthase catalytic subunit